jgi:hypothetical protein
MRTLLLTGVLLALAPAARAERLEIHGYGEGALGVTIPVSDGNWKNFADPTFKFSLRGGVELDLLKKDKFGFGFAPEAQIDLIPINANGNTFRNIGQITINASFGDYRFLIGGRFLFDFGIGAAYARFLVGADYLTGSETAAVGQFAGTANYSSTAFTLQPGVGVQFRFLKYGIAGVSLDVPVAFHQFGRNEPATGGGSFNAISFDILGTIGFRI